MKKISELRPNQHLIDNNFGGYFLSLSSIPCYNIALKNDVDQVFPNDEQYSYIYTKLFSLHNHLFYDPWSKKNLFVVDRNWKVQEFEINLDSGILERSTEVWEIPSNHTREPGHYPTTIAFPTHDLAVLTDGVGTLHVVSKEIHPWQEKYGVEVIGKEMPFIIVDCRCEVKDSVRTLHTLLLHLESVSDDTPLDDGEKVRTVTFLEWITLIEEISGGWSLQCVRQLKGKGLPDYLALEPGCRSIYIVSEHPFSFITDTNNPIVREPGKQEEKKKKNIIYMWQQNAEDIKVWLNLEEGIVKKDVKINTNGMNFSLDGKDKTLLKGVFYLNIDHDLTTWTLEGNRLNIVFQKLELGLMWKEFLKDNEEGQEIIDESVVKDVHERLSHLCSDKEMQDSEIFGSAPAFNMEQLEECDNFGETQMLSRIDGASHEITHQFTLAGHQWLFQANLNAESAPAICLRHDVHGCLWQPEPLLQDSNEWMCTHMCTFPAFGYVHASKQNRKFSLCSTDTSFTIICEANNHIYIYYPDTKNNLRNRSSGVSERTKVGKLNCIKMESSDPILGAFSVDNNLFILLKNKIYQYRISDS